MFGTIKAAAGLVGDRSSTGNWLSRDGTWVRGPAFAHTGDPNTPALPSWPRYDATGRATMMLDLQSHVERNPGGTARSALDGLPPYEYNIDRNCVVRG